MIGNQIAAIVTATNSLSTSTLTLAPIEVSSLGWPLGRTRVKWTAHGRPEPELRIGLGN